MKTIYVKNKMLKESIERMLSYDKNISLKELMEQLKINCDLEQIERYLTSDAIIKDTNLLDELLIRIWKLKDEQLKNEGKEEQ